MPYTNCGICGAKALVGATRCPRCEAPFVSYAEPGKSVPTVNCTQCGVQRPMAIGACPNCLASATHSSERMSRGMIMTGLGILGIMTIGYIVSRTTPRPGAAVAPSAVGAAATTPNGDSLPSGVSSRNGAPPAVPALSAAPSDGQPHTAVPHLIAVVSDSGTWEFAVATRGVYMRSAPSRTSEVLRTIDSAQRVQLGPRVYGWRPVRVGADRGWVDARLFTVVPAERP